jgi:circadian clock protein KaiC
VVLDSLSEIRLLAQSSLRYRRQILALKHYFAKHGATVLMLDDLTTDTNDKTVHSVAHGVIRLEELAPDYGAERRRLRSSSIAASASAAASRLHHRPAACASSRGWSRPSTRASSSAKCCRAARRARRAARRRHRARVEHPDPGPAGTGKSLLALTFARARERGEKAAMFVFDEELGLLFERAGPRHRPAGDGRCGS